MKVEKHMNNLLFTIGYSGFSINEFIETLKNYSINVVIDVRSVAYSERYPTYNKDSLKEVLNANGILYRNYAKEFGARQDDPRFYNQDGYLDFELFSRSEQFKSGVEKIVKGCKLGYQFALMCAEKRPIQCHRAILVSRAFYNLGFSVIHFLPENKYTTQEMLENELLDMYFPQRGQIDLFSSEVKSDEEYINSAYRMQNKKIGYRKDDEIE